jgi:hypothetical protein
MRRGVTMPLPGARYRMKDGVRLAFRGNKVVEAKNMKTGSLHDEEEFAMDRRIKKEGGDRQQRSARNKLVANLRRRNR